MKHLKSSSDIKFYHLDVQNHVSLPALVNLLFEASGKHAEANGFGMETIRERNISWIVGRVGIQFKQALVQLSSCTIETWIDRTIGPSTLRKFRVYDHQENLLATACFTYAALNLESRQPVNVAEIIGTEIPDTAYGSDIPFPAKVKPIKQNATVQNQFTVKYSDLDANQHATTTKYLQWMLDSFPLEKHTQNFFSSIDVNFASELFYQDEVSSQLVELAPNEFVVELISKQKVACRAKVVWTEKK